MEIARLRAFLQRHRRIALDTSVFIYQIEANSRYMNLTDEVFFWIEKPQNRALVSTIIMTELLVHPYREADERRVDEFYVWLSTYPNLEWVAPSLEIADLAARIRGAHGLKTPDAILAATAVSTSATALITNDEVFARVPSFETLVLEQLV